MSQALFIWKAPPPQLDVDDDSWAANESILNDVPPEGMFIQL